MPRPYAEVIGDPVAHSKSPLIHNFWLARLGIDAEYRSRRVRTDELADYFERRRGDADWLGCNITMPHKRSVEQFVDDVDMTVAMAGGAINTIGWVFDGLGGFNTDVQGIRMAMDAQNDDGRSPADENIVALIGAGSAASAAMAYFAEKPSRKVRIIARDHRAAHRLLEDTGLAGSVHGLDAAADALSDVDCVVNATSLGMVGQPPMVKTVLSGLRYAKSGALVFDMVYAPVQTELLKAARSTGRPTVDGLVMLIEQAREAFLAFFGELLPPPAYRGEVRPDRAWDAELRTLLSA